MDEIYDLSDSGYRYHHEYILIQRCTTDNPIIKAKSQSRCISQYGYSKYICDADGVTFPNHGIYSATISGKPKKCPLFSVYILYVDVW